MRSSVLAAIAAIAAFSSATPLETQNLTITSTGLDIRGSGPRRVYFCSDDHFHEDCHYWLSQDFECMHDIHLPINSFGPDPGQSCTIFANPSCIYGPNGAGWQSLRYPGWEDLGVWHWKNDIGSYLCQGD